MLLTRRALLTTAPALLPALGFASEIRPGNATARTGGRQRFPNVPLLTQDGERVRFYDDLVKGKIVMINAFYATCTGICPRGTGTLREVQERLGDRVGRDVFMYSLTLKPAEDTPDVLRDTRKPTTSGRAGRSSPAAPKTASCCGGASASS